MKKSFFKAVYIVALTVCVLSVAAAGIYGLSILKSRREHDRLTSNVQRTVSTVSKPDLNKNPIDFDKLTKTNRDIYAWIRIPKTQIDYPILQAYKEGDSFYLNHNIKKQYDINGSIYTEMQTSKDFSDPNTVIYGHNMLDGSMFQNLHKFRDKNFFNKNRYIYIYTPGHILKYEIFSAYKSDNRHILNTYDFSNEKVYSEYLKKAQNPNSLEVNKRTVSMSAKDRIITLSTCIGNETEYRYLVQGVLIDDTLTK